MNSWESIFTQSRANYVYYDEERLPEFRWDWPKGTWFQARLDHVREREPVWSLRTSRKLSEDLDLPAM